MEDEGVERLVVLEQLLDLVGLELGRDLSHAHVQNLRLQLGIVVELDV